MFEFMKLIKTVIITVVLIMLMQLPINGTTVENHALNWIRNSQASHYIQQVAVSSAILIKDGYKSVKNKLFGQHSKKSNHEAEAAK